MEEDGLQFRAEEKVLPAAGNVERLDAHAIARKDEALAGLRPQRYRKHGSQLRETVRVPLEERSQNSLGVALRAESMAAVFQFGAEFPVIVNLSIERNNRIAALRDDGLVARLEIDDFQTRDAEGDRKSTRLNSSHLVISYAVFCL